MKKEIHPEYFQKATIGCACGKVYEIGSTLEKTQVELCSNCHPFYTGKQNIIDTARRVEKFETRTALKTDGLISKKEKREKRDEARKAKEIENQKA